MSGSEGQNFSELWPILQVKNMRCGSFWDRLQRIGYWKYAMQLAYLFTPISATFFYLSNIKLALFFGQKKLLFYFISEPKFNKEVKT